MSDFPAPLHGRVFSALPRLAHLLAIAATLVLAACGSLPTNVQRTSSHALPDTSSTRLGSDIQPLVEAHPGLSGFYVLNDGQVEQFWRFSDEHMNEARESEYAEVIRELDSLTQTRFAKLDISWSEWVLACDPPSNVEAEEISAELNLAPKLREGMDRTETALDIVPPYFVPGEEFTRFLTDKAKQGIRVRILTNSLESNDVAMVHAGYMRYREELVAGGVDLYEFKAVRSRALDKKLDTNKIDAERASLSWRGTGGISAGQR